MCHGADGGPARRGGFTLVELLVGLVLGVLVLTAVYELLIAQTRLYSVQREQVETRESLRSAALVLAWELMETAPESGDIYALGPDSVVIRSVQASGIVCATARVGSERRLALREVGGVPAATTLDSALVYLPDDDGWAVGKVLGLWTGEEAWESAGSGGGGTPHCLWGDTATAPRPEVTLALPDDGTVDGAVPGSAVRIFRRMHYALFERDRLWWLGRRPAPDSSWSLLTGPLLSDGGGGLRFTYYDASGASTDVRAEVARVDVTLRGQRFRRTPAELDSSSLIIRDSVEVTGFLRNAR